MSMGNTGPQGASTLPPKYLTWHDDKKRHAFLILVNRIITATSQKKIGEEEKHVFPCNLIDVSFSSKVLHTSDNIICSFWTFSA